LIPSKYFPSLAFIKSCGDHYPGFIVPTDFVCLEVPTRKTTSLEYGQVLETPLESDLNCLKGLCIHVGTLLAAQRWMLFDPKLDVFSGRHLSRKFS
jgi:hypothetical protein